MIVGTRVTDLYHGPFTIPEIAAKTLARLQKSGRDELEPYRMWLEAAGGYRVLEFPEDTSRWVVRLGEAEERFVHIHPARWSPFTMRVRAPVLTTAVLSLAFVGVHGGDALDRTTINAVRRSYLGLAPVGRDPSADAGIGSVIALLR